MISHFSRLGISITLPATIAIYAIGIVYYSSYYRCLGFSGYAGAIPINDVLLLNLKSVNFIGAICANLVAFVYVHHKNERLENFKKAKEGSAEQAEAALSYVEIAKIGKKEKIIQGIVFVIWLATVIGLLIAGNYFVVISVVLAGTIGWVIYAMIFRVKSYDLKWSIGVFIAIILLGHASFAGYSDALKSLDGKRKISLICDSETIDGRYLGEDSSYFYIKTDSASMQISKSTVKTLRW